MKSGITNKLRINYPMIESLTVFMKTEGKL